MAKPIPSQLTIKVHYRATDSLYSKEDQKTYDHFTWVKGVCDGLTRKPGFIAVGEIKMLAQIANCSASPIYSRLNYLARNGAIQKIKHGYILTNTDLVLDNLFQFKRSKLKKPVGNNDKGSGVRTYHPYTTMTFPASANQKMVKMAKLHTLMIQTNNRQLSKSNGFKAINSVKRKNKNCPERLKNIALDYLRKAGKYQSKMTVYNLIADMEKIGLVKIHKMGLNHATDLYNINEYTLHPFGKANWDDFSKKTEKQMEQDLIKELNNADYFHDPNERKLATTLQKSIKVSVGLKRKKAKRSAMIKSEPVPLSGIEKKFIDFTERGKSVLIVNGFIPYSFLNKKIRRNMIPGILNKMIADTEGMKEILFSVISYYNIRLARESKYLFDPNATVYARQFGYPVDIVTLVEGNGNYKGESIKSFDESRMDAISDRQSMTKVDTKGYYLSTFKSTYNVSSLI